MSTPTSTDWPSPPHSGKPSSARSRASRKRTRPQRWQRCTDNWPGAGKKPSELTKDERGDRYWDKKNAAASLTLLIKVHSLIGMQTRGGTPSDNPGQDDEAFALGQQVSKAEREALAIIARLQKGKK